MAKVSFSKGTGNPDATQSVAPADAVPASAGVSVTQTAPGVSEVTVEPATTPAPAAAPASAGYLVPRAPAQVPATTPFSDSADEIDFSQIRLPKFKIVQGVGALSQAFSPGQVVIAASGDIIVPLNEAPPKTGAKNQGPQVPAEIIVVAVRSKDRYTEKTEHGDDSKQGRLLNTEAEVFATGGTTNYDEAAATGKPLFRPMCSALILVRKPAELEDDTGLFTIDLFGGKWTLVVWDMVGVSYTNAAKTLRTARRFTFLRRSWAARRIGITTLHKSYQNGHAAFIPQIKPLDPELTAAETAEVSALLSGI